MELSREILHQLELLEVPPEEIASLGRIFRANGIGNLDNFIAHCLHGLIQETDGRELIAWLQ